MSALDLEPVLIAAPAQRPVSVVEAREHLRVDHADDDMLIAAYLDAATAHVEQVTGRALVTQTWRAYFSAFSDRLRLPKRPVQSIVAVTYYDDAGALQTGAADLYGLRLDALGHYVYRASAAWPAIGAGPDAVRIDFLAGYGGPGDVPPPLRQAILMLAAGWYASRESVSVNAAVTPIPFAVDALLSTYFVPRV